MTRSEHIQALLEEYARQRARDEADQERRVAEACEKAPRIAQLRSESASLALNAMRSILDQSTPEQRAAVAVNSIVSPACFKMFVPAGLIPAPAVTTVGAKSCTAPQRGLPFSIRSGLP